MHYVTDNVSSKYICGNSSADYYSSQNNYTIRCVQCNEALAFPHQ